MNRRVAKAIAQGSSIAVVLPADWCRGNNVTAGTKLLIEYSDAVMVRLLAVRGGRA